LPIKLLDETLKIPLLDGLPKTRHQLLIVVKVVDGV
jgi:hypothetical protein